MKQFINQIHEKIYRAHQCQYPEFTDFLDLHQLSIYRQTFKAMDDDLIAIESHVFHDDERRMIGFFPKTFLNYIEDDYMTLFPVVAIQVRTSDVSSIPFNHRDLLGSLLGQGVDRRLFGDIIFNEDAAYFLCHERIGHLLIDQLLFVGHHAVTCSFITDWNYLKSLAPKAKEISTTVSSLRLDNIMKAMLNTSRTECQHYILKGAVRVNQEEITKRHHVMNERDIISIRGKGKFKIQTIGNTTKKGRIWITILQYI